MTEEEINIKDALHVLCDVLTDNDVSSADFEVTKRDINLKFRFSAVEVNGIKIKDL